MSGRMECAACMDRLPRGEFWMHTEKTARRACRSCASRARLGERRHILNAVIEADRIRAAEREARR
jgi:hypothetical protein